jgi:hypothetical protein
MVSFTTQTSSSFKAARSVSSRSLLVQTFRHNLTLPKNLTQSCEPHVKPGFRQRDFQVG